MTPQSIYKTVLLPEILDFCLDFFPMLVAQSQGQCHQASIPNTRETSDSLNQFNEWLKRCLAAPLTQISETSSRSIPPNIDALGVELTQHINFVTDSGLTAQSNPLSQHRLIDALDKAFTNNCDNSPVQLMAAIEAQFTAQAYGFYNQLNDLCCAYYRPQNPATDTDSIVFGGSIPKPRKCLDTDSHEELSPQSLGDAEDAIKTVKHFFETELCSEKVGEQFYALGKKLYIPVINCVLTNPRVFLSDADGSVHKLLQCVAKIAHHREHSLTPQSEALATQAEEIIQRFISSAMEGSVSIRQSLQALQKLADQCLDTDTQNNAETTNSPVSTQVSVPPPLLKAPKQEQSLLSSQPAHQSERPPIADSTENHTEKPPQKSASHKPKPTPLPNIQYQAENLLQTILADNDQYNCMAAKLKGDWQQVLEHIGSRFGPDTQAWRRAMDIFVQLTQYGSAKAMPVALARQVESQLRSIGIKNTLISSRTSSRRIGPQYAAILKEGNWFSYNKNGKVIRCKLGAIIRQIGRYIFISRRGQKVLEIEYSDLKKELAIGALVPLDNDPFNNSLEDILCNIRHAQAKEVESEFEANI